MLSIKKSAQTKKPVRVIRGYKLPSKYAPVEGYRYDGLYVVEKAWMAKGLTKGLLVCRYAFRRLEGQGELQERSEEEMVEADEDQQDATKTEEPEKVCSFVKNEVVTSEKKKKRTRGGEVESVALKQVEDIKEDVVEDTDAPIRKRARKFVGVVLSTVRKALVA